MMLLAECFNVVSTDASDKMLKYALKERWRRRKEEGFDKWGNYKECTRHVIDILYANTKLKSDRQAD